MACYHKFNIFSIHTHSTELINIRWSNEGMNSFQLEIEYVHEKISFNKYIPPKLH